MFRRTGLHLICALALAAVAYAQPAPPPPPAKAPTAPLPPPLPEYAADSELEPQITIIRRETETIEEVRVNDDLRYVKVTPRIGTSLLPGAERQWPDVSSLRFARLRVEDADVAPVLLVN